MSTEYFQTGSKKGRGRAQRSRDLIQAMYDIAEEAQPITRRGVGYKLFSLGLIKSSRRVGRTRCPEKQSPPWPLNAKAARRHDMADG